MQNHQGLVLNSNLPHIQVLEARRTGARGTFWGEERQELPGTKSCPVPGASCSQPEILGRMASSTCQDKESTRLLFKTACPAGISTGENAIHTLLVSYYPHFLFCIWDSVSTHSRPPTATFSQGQLRGLYLALHLSEALNKPAKHRRRLLPNINFHSVRESCPQTPPIFTEVYSSSDQTPTTARPGQPVGGLIVYLLVSVKESSYARKIIC